MTKRHEWKFQYEARKLAEQAAFRSGYHQGRVAWWKDKKAQVMVKVRESGIEIHESQAAAYSNKMGREPRVVIDQTLQADLVECHDKIQAHMAAAIEYAGWQQVLNANPSQVLELNQDDYLYFFRDPAVFHDKEEE